MVPSQKAEKFRSRTDVEAIGNLRVATFSSPEMEGLAHNLLPPAKVVSVNNYYDLPRFEDFDAALWTETPAVGLTGPAKESQQCVPRILEIPFSSPTSCQEIHPNFSGM